MNIKQLISMCEHEMERSDTPELAKVTIILGKTDVDRSTEIELFGVRGELFSNNGNYARVKFNAGELHKALTKMHVETRGKINV